MECLKGLKHKEMSRVCRAQLFQEEEDIMLNGIEILAGVPSNDDAFTLEAVDGAEYANAERSLNMVQKLSAIVKSITRHTLKDDGSFTNVDALDMAIERFAKMVFFVTGQEHSNLDMWNTEMLAAHVYAALKQQRVVRPRQHLLQEQGAIKLCFKLVGWLMESEMVGCCLVWGCCWDACCCWPCWVCCCP